MVKVVLKEHDMSTEKRRIGVKFKLSDQQLCAYDRQGSRSGGKRQDKN